MEAVLRDLREGVEQYANAVGQVDRTSLRARLLHLLEELDLQPRPLTTRRVNARDLRGQTFLRGATSVHLDLVFRSSLTTDEIMSTAEHGMVFLATRPDLDDLPVGVMLAQPTTGLVRHRRDLFRSPPALEEAGTLMPFALAASPSRLGAGSALFAAIMTECDRLPSRPRVVTLSPMTGMRARVIRLVDEGWDTVRRVAAATHPDLDTEQLREQLLGLLGHQQPPEPMPEPVASWLAAEADRFARSPEYKIGNFHRALGASLIGIAPGGDVTDSDALWARAYFDHGGGSARP